MRASDGSAFKDRSAGLLFFGIIELLIGLMCALMIPLSVLAAKAAGDIGGSSGEPELGSTVASSILYGCVAAVFVWIGAGSIRARRWAQKMMLVVSWLWLITGVFTLAVCVWMIPALLGQIFVEGEPGADVITAVMLVMFVFVSAVFIVLPAVFVMFYRSPHVIATCRARDPEPNRIADAPPHIVSLVVIYVFGAVSALTMPAYNFVMPVFGVVLSGPAGAVAWTGVLGLLAYLVWFTLKRDPKAWWIAWAASVVAMLSSTVAFAVVPLQRLIASMELPADQAGLFQAAALPGPRVLVLVSVIAWGSFLFYLWYTRRFFADP